MNQNWVSKAAKSIIFYLYMNKWENQSANITNKIRVINYFISKLKSTWKKWKPIYKKWKPYYRKYDWLAMKITHLINSISTVNDP